MKLDNRGVLHVPLALLCLLMAVTGLGLWGILHHWKSLTQTQLRLDRCTGEPALDLKSKLQTIGSANQHIRELRITEAAAMIPNPPLAAALKVTIEEETLRQESLRVQWLMKQGKWVVQGGCGGHGDIMAPLPNLDWFREPPDQLGEQPLDMEMIPTSFTFAAYHSPRASAAEVFSGDDENESSWFARWIAPQAVLRPSLR